ncbi:hypothetical protein PLICRDRAFT_44725 [Plicaturopsis crispa FD-325 SS-3]|nr:hypothetical protein PLICRDRAFT_44725 [Plicaturopsis crispa FD-325 SS-3]
MKFAASAAALLLASASSVYAAKHPKNALIQSRQAHIRRDILDVCAALDVDLSLPDILKHGEPLVTGHLDVCLCISVLPTFIQVDAAAQAAVALLGEGPVTATLEALINEHPSSSKCVYPPHAHALCSTSSPCSFNCTDGYTPFPASKPTQCVCAAPYTECNGKCGSFPQGCGSQAASKKRTLMPRCAPDQSVCGLQGGSGYDCVNTQSDVESCGGCATRTPFGAAAASGVDCTALPHVDKASASCAAGVCVIEKCAEGFAPSADKTSCAPLVKRDGNGINIDLDLDDILSNNTIDILDNKPAKANPACKRDGINIDIEASHILDCNTINIL